MKSIRSTILILFVLLILTGCWNNRDITELSLVAGVAIDKSDTGEIKITAQIVRPSALKPSGEGGSSSEKGYINISASGETVFEAVRNLLKISNKKPYWGYNQLLVISEVVAKEGLSDYLDFFNRDHEQREKAYILIAKDMEAKTVLECESRMDKLPATHDVGSFENIYSFSKSLQITLLDLYKEFDQKQNGIVLPILYPGANKKELTQEDLILEGSAIIKDDKLSGYLNPNQTRAYLFAKNKLKSTIINVTSPIDKKKKIAIEIIRSKGQVSAELKNGKPALSIKIEAEGNIGEQNVKAKLIDTNYINKIEQEVKKQIKGEIRETVNLTQRKFECDIFGFIGKLNKGHYKYWEKMVGSWGEVYSKTAVDIKVNFRIRRVGLTNQSSGLK